VIIDRSGGSVIGDIGFHGPPSDGGSVEIGFSIVPSRRRRGHASEAAAALLAWAREQPEVSQVVARCHPDNEASIGTLRRAGLAPVGSSEGMLRWQ
jgi:ribosomal-protein-alanine N-acetyltransferase